jgi:ribosome-associated toxin RatA of RatAB toxin-antitoxin module
MTKLKHAVDIDRSLADVYHLAQQVERYPEFLPGYMESRILENIDGELLVERKAMVHGKVTQWRSLVRFNGHDEIQFTHAAGPLKGMRVVWSFSPVSSMKTRLQIVHHVRVPRRWPVGWILEKTYYGPAINKIAHGVVRDFKQACETAGTLS